MQRNEQSVEVDERRMRARILEFILVSRYDTTATLLLSSIVQF